jgi:hypothetical protein
MMALAKGLAARGEPVVASAATLVEAINPAVAPAAVLWAVSGLEIVDVTRAVALAAAGLLRAAGRHGHADALDAIVGATAVLAKDRPVTVLTSDPRDLSALLDDHPEISVLATT